ncbi:hypothetical protein NWFMUON74_37960 [Nocardia wallacei]|uniref:Uncharacterized protein n=1 Tax=Nocardia wallacei TaxID=480035 RepID=A0A7G1KS29_9NOCA|nr:hypothetical protein NWFMUON74_37960 [Nocardia wallacei]
MAELRNTPHVSQAHDPVVWPDPSPLTSWWDDVMSDDAARAGRIRRRDVRPLPAPGHHFVY